MEEVRSFTNPVKFWGKGSSLFGIYIVNTILTIITLGFYYPWAKAAMLKYLYQETELNNSRFVFHGTGREMFIGYIKAVGIFIVLYAVLIGAALSSSLVVRISGMLGFYVAIAILIPFAIHGAMKYRMSRTSWRSIHFGYRGNRAEFVKEFLIGFFLTFITLGIYSSWFSIKIRKYIIGHIRFGNIQFEYNGDGLDYFLLNLKGIFLTIITLGIYSFWYARDLFNYYIDNIQLEQDGSTIQLRSGATGGGFFRLYIVNLLIIVFSLGLATPWAIIRTLRFIFANVWVEGELQLDTLQQTEKDYNDATGEDVADMLDLGLV